MSKTNEELEHGLVADLYEDEEWDSFWSGLAGLATTVTFLICL